MSHAMGAVRFLSDGTVMFYEYSGTLDVTISHLYATCKEVTDNWRKGEWLQCTCGQSEPTEIYTSYGYGYSWMGKACRSCRAITDGLEPGEEVFTGKDLDDSPDWVSAAMKADQEPR